MENFPQTYEPTGSQSILEQFVGLKNFMNNKFNSNEYIKTTEQTLTEEQKEQARQNIGAGASTINVVDNLTSQSYIDALSANQGRVLNEKIGSNVQTLNNKIDSNVQELQTDIAGLQGDVSELNQEIAKALKTPMTRPTETEIVGIDSTNSQILIPLNSLVQRNGSNITNEDIENWKTKLGYENIETIYDMNSENSSINLGYTNGIQPDSTVNLNTSKYKRLLIFTEWATLTLDLTQRLTVTQVGFTIFSTWLFTYLEQVTVNEAKTTISFALPFYSSKGAEGTYSNVKITKIEGFY